MIAVKQSVATLWDDSAQAMLALAERQISKVLTVAVQAIESNKSRLTATEQQVLKMRAAMFIEANNLAIKHGGFRLAL